MQPFCLGFAESIKAMCEHHATDIRQNRHEAYSEGYKDGKAMQGARLVDRLDYEQALIGALNECAIPRGLHAKIRAAFWLRVDAAIAQE